MRGERMVRFQKFKTVYLQAMRFYRHYKEFRFYRISDPSLLIKEIF